MQPRQKREQNQETSRTQRGGLLDPETEKAECHWAGSLLVECGGSGQLLLELKQLHYTCLSKAEDKRPQGQSAKDTKTGLPSAQWAVTAVWLSGSISGLLFTTATFSLTFCRTTVIHQFFCDVPQLIKLSCSNDYLGVVGVNAFMAMMALICFTSIVLSYIHIFSTVLRIPSSAGRSKAFSTCLPHLFVVSFFLSTGIFEFLKPTSDSPTVFDLMVSIFYTVIPPTLNPVIYSLRNEVMKEAFRKLVLGGEFTRKKIFLSCC
ncbi:olfactory receptor 14J1-like [Orycteropus afer afer]|uniref:Olfactory receptor 14J1-like n=1 Tax=Orycteropus afer afer TaxID=1230840 RepID=A0A8B7B925_ORYAF|nr:olfactory receptor 14J1-like [Orycteropus afer afer]